jgi:hypothetical protein
MPDSMMNPLSIETFLAKGRRWPFVLLQQLLLVLNKFTQPGGFLHLKGATASGTVATTIKHPGVVAALGPIGTAKRIFFNAKVGSLSQGSHGVTLDSILKFSINLFSFEQYQSGCC